MGGVARVGVVREEGRAKFLVSSPFFWFLIGDLFWFLIGHFGLVSDWWAAF